jgi:hypothetical protein
MSHRVRKPVFALLALSSLFGAVAVASSESSPGASVAAKPLKLEEATMIIELNSTDGDAGLQAFLDGEPWRSMTISSPDGRKLVDVRNKGRLRSFGLTELFTESNEPPFDELPLKKFLRRFPEGTYRFSGRTIEGRKLVGKAKLSHDIPDGPTITSPTEGATIARDGAVASWEPVPDGGGVEISGYRAIVERENPLRVFQVELPPSVTRVTIPPEYLEVGAKHKIEIQAIDRSGNQTISELEFRVG